MSEYGKVLIKFNQPILLPAIISNPIWDHIFEMHVLSNDNENIYIGKFVDIVNKRELKALNETSESNLLAFFPIVSNYSEDTIEIDFNFVNKKKLSADQQAVYEVNVVKPSVFRTKEIYLPLTGNSFEYDEPFSIGPVPA